MILWTIKLLREVRKAIAGRRFPAQLAWAVAFGILLGIIPHGNLLAIGMLLVVLSLKLNHAMAGLTAIATSFLARTLDPVSHQLGDYVLTHPQVTGVAMELWQWPLVPWTDLNNTVVMGSFLIGVTAILPAFFITYPIFRALAARAEAKPASPEPPPPGGGALRPGQVAVAKHAHEQLSGPHRTLKPASRPILAPACHAPPDEVSGRDEVSNQEEDAEQPAENVPAADVPAKNASAADDPANNASSADASSADGPPEEERTAVETRIDVIRMSDYRTIDPDVSETSSASDPATSDDAAPMDEALRYLLHQLRDSQQRKAA